MSTSDPSPPEEGATRPRGWRRALRIVRRVVRFLRRLVLVVVLLVVAAVGWVLGTESGIAFAVAQGLSFYNDLIPGHLTVGRVSGTVLDHLQLHDVEGTDAQGVTRVRLRRFGLDWSPATLVDRALPVDAVAIEGLWLLLGPAGDAAPLLDLAPPPSATPPPPPPPSEGPLRLPVDLSAHLRLREVQVAVEGAPLLLLDLAALDLDATVETPPALADGTGAHARIGVELSHLAVAAPQSDLAVSHLGLAASFDGAEAKVPWLAVDSNLGAVRGADLRFDLATERGGARLTVRGSAAALNARLGASLPTPLVEDPVVTLAVGGGVGGFDLRVGVDAGAGARVALALAGALQPAPNLDLTVHLLELDPQRALGPGDAADQLVGAQVAGHLTARVVGPPTPLAALAQLDPAALTASVSVRCPDCSVPPIGAFRAAVDAHLEGGVGRAEVEVSALGTRVSLEADVADALRVETTTLAARWSISSADVGPAARLGGQRVGGALRTHGGCTGRLDALVCRGSVALDGVKVPDQRLAVRAVDVRFEAVPLVDPPRFDATVKVSGVRAPGVPRPISATVTARGRPDDVEVSVDARHGRDRLETALRLRTGPPLRVDLRRLRARYDDWQVATTQAAWVERTPSGRIRVKGLRLAALGGAVAVDGTVNLAGRSDLTLAIDHLDLAGLARVVPDLAGVLDLDLRFVGPLAGPELDLTVALAGAGYQGQVVGDLAVQVGARGGAVEVAVDLVAGAGVAGAGVAGAGVAGAGVAGAGVAGAGVAGERRIAVRARAPLVLNLAAGKVAPRFDQPHRLRVSWRGVAPAWFGALAPMPEGVDFNLNGDLGVDGTATEWRTTLAVQGHAKGGGLAPVPLDLRVEATPTRQQLGLSAQVTPPPPPEAFDAYGKALTAPPPVPLTVAAEARLRLADLLPPPFGTAQPGAPLKPDPSTPIKAVVKVPAFGLEHFVGFLPPGIDELSGSLRVDATADGTLGDPHLTGGVLLSDAGVTVVAIGQRLRDLGFEIGLVGREVQLKNLRFRAGDGRASGHGGATLSAAGALGAHFDLKLTEFPVLAPSVPPLKVGLRMIVKAEVPPVGMRRVGVTLKGTEIVLMDLSVKGPRPIPTSDAVTYLDPDARPAEGTKAQAVGAADRAAPGAAAGAGTKAAASPPGPPVLTELLVDVQDPIQVRGAMLDMAWGGRLRLVVGGARPVVEGALVAKRGFFELLGKRFTLDEGEVTLADGAAGEPFLRVAATTRTEYADVTATIRGRATRPELVFTANPQLPEEQILSLLVTGSPTPNEGEQRTVQEQAANLLAGFSSPRLEGALQDSLGIDRVRLTFGEGGLDTPILSFGKHVTRWLYVEGRYRYNALPEDNETEVNAEAEVIPRWTLESRYGDRGVGGLDVFWSVPISPSAYARVNAAEDETLPEPGAEPAADPKPEPPAAPDPTPEPAAEPEPEPEPEPAPAPRVEALD